MDDEHLFGSLKLCCWGISEVLRNMPRCPHSFRRAPDSEQGQLCADCLNITTKLSLIAIQLGEALEFDSDKEVKKLADDMFNILQGVCFWQRSVLLELQQKRWNLATVTELFDGETHREALGRNISQYLGGPPTVREGLVKRCDRLLTALQPEEKEHVVKMMEPYDHSCSHKALFSALGEYTPCDSCHLPRDSETPGSWHPTRLFLVEPTVDRDDMVHFDIIASSEVITSSTQDGWWQDLCIKIPLALKQNSTAVSSNGSTTQPSLAKLESFCQIFESDDGCRISLKASPGTGISLADVLDQYELSVKQKLSLAHSVALAFWQYYDSQLMHRAWTSHTIWFMPEPDLEDDSERLPLRTYIAFYPEATKCDYDASEFIMAHSLIHRCPRIQYLALLLLEIGLGRPFRGRSFDRQVLQLNYYNSIASKYLEELKSVTWENFAHKSIFTDAVEECLKFDGLTGKDETPDTSNRHTFRRSQIHEKVVSPLRWLNSSFQRANAQIDYLPTKRHALVPKLDESHFTSSDLVEDDEKIEASGMCPADRGGFETAIICALTLEADAVEALFDHHWDDNSFYGKAPGDPNAYSTGSMGRHNVVLTYMSGMGKSAAASVAAWCRMRALKKKMAQYLDELGKESTLRARYPESSGRGYPSLAITPKPAVHFGLIASGDTVMKSAEQRDDIAIREKTIAFEMEGAAVWETFPCLVIKGACDYADSCKTKLFQRYAAATAAACTKAFLDSWESSERGDYVR